MIRQETDGLDQKTADKSTEASLWWLFHLFPADSLNGWKASGD